MLIFAIVLIYGSRRYEILRERGDTNHNDWIETKVVDWNQPFDFEKTGFTIAFQAKNSVN